MEHQCQARTRAGTRCRCHGSERVRVLYTDGARVFTLCAQHAREARQDGTQPFTFRAAVNVPADASR